MKCHLSILFGKTKQQKVCSRGTECIIYATLLKKTCTCNILLPVSDYLSDIGIKC